MEEERKETTEVEEKLDKDKEAPKYETKIVDIFKLLLGYNYHGYGTKKESL